MAEQTIPVAKEHGQPQIERRAWIRFATSQEFGGQPAAAFTAEEAGRAWWGRLLDISAGGLGLVLSRRFEPGSILIVDLSDKANGGACSCPVQVVHTTPEGNRRWIIGCEFLRPLSEEELQAFAAE